MNKVPKIKEGASKTRAIDRRARKYELMGVPLLAIKIIHEAAMAIFGFQLRKNKWSMRNSGLELLPGMENSPFQITCLFKVDGLH